MHRITGLFYAHLPGNKLHRIPRRSYSHRMCPLVTTLRSLPLSLSHSLTLTDFLPLPEESALLTNARVKMKRKHSQGGGGAKHPPAGLYPSNHGLASPRKLQSQLPPNHSRSHSCVYARSPGNYGTVPAIDSELAPFSWAAFLCGPAAHSAPCSHRACHPRSILSRPSKTDGEEAETFAGPASVRFQRNGNDVAGDRTSLRMEVQPLVYSLHLVTAFPWLGLNGGTEQHCGVCEVTRDWLYPIALFHRSPCKKTVHGFIWASPVQVHSYSTLLL